MTKRIIRQYTTCLLILLTWVTTNAQKVSDIQGVTIQKKAIKYKSKKENPAYAIMQKVWAHKHDNGLAGYKTYTFDEYEKIEFDLNNIDSTFMKKKVFNKMGFIFKYADSTDTGSLALPMFLNEATYKNFGENAPEKHTKRLMTAQKTSGFKDNQILALTAKNLYKDINIYDNTLNYFNIGFQSPVSTTGFSTYDYNLIDTVSVRGEKSYHIKFFPRREAVTAFRGDLYISAEKYAVVKAELHSSKNLNVNFVNRVSTSLEFDNPDDNTFLPTRNETEFELAIAKSKKGKGMIAKRTVDYTHYTFNQPIDGKVFENKADPTGDQLAKDDAYWQKSRTDSLGAKEAGIYDMLDKLQKVPKFKHGVKLFETLSSGYYHVTRGLDIGDLYATLGFNEVEGTRLRLGARTYFTPNDDWRIQGYTAYGFRDNQLKYGVEARYMFNKDNRLMAGIGTRRDILQLGVQLTTDDGIMSRSFASSSILSTGSNTSLSSVSQTSAFVGIEPWKNFQVRVDGTTQSIKSALPEKFNLNYFDENGQLQSTTNDTHLTLGLIATPGAKYSETGIDRYSHTTLSPTIVLKYTKGLRGLLNSDFGYDKLQFLYTQPFLIGSWGKMVATAEAGKNFGTVPLALQSVLPGNQSYGLVPNTFALLNYYEFVADSYATINLEHHFNGKILGYIPLINKLKIREIGIFRAAYGTLSEAAKGINQDGGIYSAPSGHAYYEYGFGLENIGFGNLRFLRVDFNWRGNYLDHPEAKKFGIKAGIQISF